MKADVLPDQAESKVKAKCGAKPKYTTGHVIITRSVPAGLIPEMDTWLIEAKKRHEIKVKEG